MRAYATCYDRYKVNLIESVNVIAVILSVTPRPTALRVFCWGYEDHRPFSFDAGSVCSVNKHTHYSQVGDVSAYLRLCYCSS